MTPDDVFLRAFFGFALPDSEFHHRDPLRLALLSVRRHGAGGAAAVEKKGSQRFAEHHIRGWASDNTMTRFGVRLVANAVSRRPEIVDFETFLDEYPLLLDKNPPLRHWSREVMFAPDARAAWRDPDLVALPF